MVINRNQSMRKKSSYMCSELVEARMSTKEEGGDTNRRGGEAMRVRAEWPIKVWINERGCDNATDNWTRRHRVPMNEAEENPRVIRSWFGINEGRAGPRRGITGTCPLH